MWNNIEQGGESGCYKGSALCWRWLLFQVTNISMVRGNISFYYCSKLRREEGI